MGVFFFRKTGRRCHTGCHSHVNAVKHARNIDIRMSARLKDAIIFSIISDLESSYGFPSPVTLADYFHQHSDNQNSGNSTSRCQFYTNLVFVGTVPHSPVPESSQQKQFGVSLLKLMKLIDVPNRRL